MLFVNALNQAFRNLLDQDGRVVLLGEDIVDPYGGAFKVTLGLSTDFPERVFATPISEASIVGMGTGLALQGLRPVVEIMFGDFVGLAFDQFLNSATKFPEMYGNGVTVPLMVRTPMGGGRGYGPTHSQCLEKFFLGIPGLKVIALSLHQDLNALLNHAILCDESTKLVVEHKLLYPMEMLPTAALEQQKWHVYEDEGSGYPTLGLSIVPVEECQVTVVAYGYTAHLAQQACFDLMINEEIACHVVIPTLLSPFDFTVLRNSVQRTGHLLVVEEGTLRYGFGSELAATVQEEMPGVLKKPVKRCASTGVIVPSSKSLESRNLVGAQDIYRSVLDLLGI